MTSSPDFVSRRLDDEVVLMNLRTNKMFALNRTGARAWELLQTGYDRAAIRDVLLTEFDVRPEDLDRELCALSELLAAEGFVQPQPSSGPPLAPPRAPTEKVGGDNGSMRTLEYTTASLLVRMGAWSLVLPLLKHLVSLPTLVSLMSRRAVATRSDAVERRIVHSVGHIYRMRRPGTCLERSLLAYRYLAGASADPQLVVGVRREARDVIGHAWVLVDGRPLFESSVALESFVPVVAFASDGYATTAVSDRGSAGPRFPQT
jgi:hypothetical protein